MSTERIGLQVDVETGKVTGEVANLRKELREAERAVAAVSEKFGATSKEAQAAAKRAAEFRDRMGDAKALTDAFNPDRKFQAFSAALQGVTGGISALQGGMALLGVQSEDTEKTLLKVQAALALSQGINSVLELKDQFTNLVSVLSSMTVVQKANALANTLAAGTMRLFGVATVQTGTAFNVLKGAIIATGIGALVVLLGTVISLVTEWASETERLAEAQKEAIKYTESLDKAQLEYEKNYIDRNKRLEIARAKARGASEEEIAAIELRFEESRLESLKRLSKDEQDIKDQNANVEILKLNEQARKRKEAEDKIAADKAKRLAQQKKEDGLIGKANISSTNIQGLGDPLLVAEFKRKEEEAKLAEDRKKVQDSITSNLQKNVALQLEEKAKAIEADRQQTANENTEAENRKKIAQLEAQAKSEFYNLTGQALMTFANLAGEQTAIGKTLAIASTTISTYQAAQAAYASQMNIPTPDAPIRATIAAAIAVAAGLARVKAIVAVKVPKASAGASLPSAQAGGGLSPNPIQNTNTQLDSKSIDSIGNKAVKAYVLESDNASSAERAKRLSRAGVLNG